MENKRIINCPNCNKRTFADNNECIYCKYILKEKEHNFDKEIYKFLYTKYNESKSKPDTIKVGMEKFGLSLKETKEIVDNISENIYNIEKSKEKDSTQEKVQSINKKLTVDFKLLGFIISIIVIFKIALTYLPDILKIIFTVIFGGVVIIYLINRKTLKEAKGLNKKTYGTITGFSSHRSYVPISQRVLNTSYEYDYTISYEYTAHGVTFYGETDYDKIFLIPPKPGGKIGIYYDNISPSKHMLAYKRNGFRNATLIYMCIILYSLYIIIKL